MVFPFNRLHQTLKRRPSRRQPHLRRPALEYLEGRCLLSGNVLQTNLVSDLMSVAAVTDPNLVNPWGIAESSGSPFWISDNNAGVSTLYKVPGANNTPVTTLGLVVSIPTPVDALGSSGAPTGTVFNIDNPNNGFEISGVDTNGKAITASPFFLFATEDGTIVGWNPGVNPKGFDPAKAGTYGIIAKDNSGNNFTNPDPNQQTGAVYKGLAIAMGTGGAPISSTDPNSTALLYAANFRAGQIEAYDPNFQPAKLPMGAFTDPNLPEGYAPFDVQVLGDKVYVTYALQNETKHDDVGGPHHGFVDVFNLDGTPGLPNGTERLVSRGPLDSPWGLAIAPSSFGSLAGALLVGNFRNGRINAFNATTGVFLGGLKDPDGEPIQIDGLWTLRVGNDGAGGKSDTIYFTAGLDHETHGLFGSLTPVAPGTPEGPAEAQMVQAALDVFQIDLTTVMNDISSGASKATLQQDLRTLQTAFVDLVHAEAQFTRDSRADLGSHGQDGGGSSHGLDRDALGDFFADLGRGIGDLD
jgi:uncharacterized protein (TIGR03118 family)